MNPAMIAWLLPLVAQGIEFGIGQYKLYGDDKTPEELAEAWLRQTQDFGAAVDAWRNAPK